MRCVAVQSTGTLPSSVRLYTQGVTNTPTGGALTRSTSRCRSRSAPPAARCGTFTAASSIVAAGTTLATLDGFTSYANSKDTTWSPVGGTTETRAFRFTVTPDSAMPNTQQGASTGVTFVWEADNT